MGLPGGTVVKNPLAKAEDTRDMDSNPNLTSNPNPNPWVRNIPWSRKWQRAPVFLPGKFHGQRSLAGYSPRGHKESDTTACMYFVFLHLENYMPFIYIA